MNVLPTKLAAFERLVHKSQHSETVGDDTKTGVTVLGMEDMRVKAYLIQNSARIASWTQMREGILEITRTQQYNDSQPVPGVRVRSKGKCIDSQDKGKSKDKDTKNESSKKSRTDDKIRCLLLCQETGHVWSRCGSRLKDLADAEERSADTTLRSDAGSTAPNKRETYTYDFNVRNMSNVGHMCGRRHLPKRT